MICWKNISMGTTESEINFGLAQPPNVKDRFFRRCVVFAILVALCIVFEFLNNRTEG